MKITAIIPDELIEKVAKLSKGGNTTESLLIALREWVSGKELAAITAEVRKRPLRFSSQDIAKKVRTLNRR